MQRWSWHKCRYGEELLSKIAGRGVHVPVARTFGMDHIGLDAAARLGTAAGNARYAPDSAADFTLMLALVALRHCRAAVCQQNVNDYSLKGSKAGRSPLLPWASSVTAPSTLPLCRGSPALAARFWPQAIM